MIARSEGLLVDLMDVLRRAGTTALVLIAIAVGLFVLLAITMLVSGLIVYALTSIT